jgi:S1-C subfamily serine protease
VRIAADAGPLIAYSDALEALVERTLPGVVGVTQGRGQGTGFVIASDGYVLTNAHVAGSGRRLKVVLGDGEALPAERVGNDPATDLAVLRVDGAPLEALSLSEARAPAVGQVVVAIGNPLWFDRSVSVGIISALERSLSSPQGGLFEGLIQTDAAINPGNSGGPLVNARGEVVGINTAIIPWAQGIGFAIPARTASWVTGVLLQRGEVPRRFLGVGARGEVLRSPQKEALGQGRAVRILEVGADTPASRGGLLAGDLLLTLNGREVGSVDDVHRVLVAEPEREVALQVWRRRARVQLSVRPEAERRAA